MVEVKDEEELIHAFRSLKLAAFRGCANTCSKCGKTGHFGSIIKYTCDSGNDYVICGWCANIKPIQNKEN